MQRLLNSANHAGAGQNVLFNGGHVVWSAHSWVGVNDDCIYGPALIREVEGVRSQNSPARTSAGIDPRLEFDTVLLPFAALAPRE